MRKNNSGLLCNRNINLNIPLARPIYNLKAKF